MSGDTQDISMEAESTDSALIWTDNPELEYFRSMMASNAKDKLESGSDVDDSLIGNSTICEMLELLDDNESNSREKGQSLQHPVVRDTSGLSDAESNTVDNIFVGDESILAMKKTMNRVVDDGTIETIENKDPIPLKTGGNVVQDQLRYRSQEQMFIIPQLHKSDSPQKPLPQRQLFPELDIADNRRINRPGESDESSTHIPGVIFVTEGHSSVVRTCPNLQDVNPKKGKGNVAKEKSRCLLRSLFVSVTLVIIIASTIAGVMVYRMKLGKSVLASSSSSRQNNDFPISTPNTAPTPVPSNLRAKNQPVAKKEPEKITSAPASDSSADRAEIPARYPIESPKVSPSASPTKSTFLTPADEDLTDPTNSPTLEPISFTEDSLDLIPIIESNREDLFIPTPTMNPTIMTKPSPVPTTVPIKLSEAPTQRITDFSTFLSTVASSEASSAAETCESTIESDKNCYQNGEDIQISFKNCQPKSSDWIGVYYTRQGVRNLNQPTSWIWTCGNQLCSDPVDSGTATLVGASGTGSFRAYLLRSNDNNGAGYSAYAIGNRFTISSRCRS